jgi:phospholipid/cholesterol/gamma-HCH transport system substrate-binding protein
MIRWIKSLNEQLVGSGVSRIYVTRPGLIGAVAVAVVLLVLAAAAVVPTVIYHLRTNAYSAVLPSSGGLSVGDPVDVAGIPAGRVEGLRIEGDQVLADFRLDRSRTLGEDTEAEVKLRTVLGAYYLDVRPLGRGELADGVIPIDRTGVPFSFDEIARSAYNATRTDEPEREQIDYAQLETLADLVYDSLPDRELADQAITALGDAAAIINDKGDQVQEILSLGKEISEIVDNQQDTLTTLFDQGAVVFGTLGQRAELLSGLIRDLELVAARITQLLTEEPGEWDTLLVRVREVTDMLASESAGIDANLKDLAPAFRRLADVSGNGPWVDVNAPAAIVPDNLLCLLGAVEGCR